MVRGLFVIAVVYAAVLIHPVDAPVWINMSVGLAVAVAIAFAEARLQDAAATLDLLTGIYEQAARTAATHRRYHG